ncbi:undecaprenyl-phosphate glucose phosphotransferase [Vibrio sp. SCSIO 43136]|uniref:undecaprenyl-phosphate glucose phosphotransferase n=1 Tax=Vibrio sp. SCSIO 43136 TaxID=2819101 RepID=UPI0020754B2E|nr:undecaprenyl-phosphate glucose phosphotransferase [Vibrio sp. SCSIO 43136]USD67043.1 undecaprenyl-phosphate glucose phosphotransferase [Vibrio sp. SCSIO 43136]
MRYGNRIKHYAEDIVLVYRLIDIVYITAVLVVTSLLYLGSFSPQYQMILCVVIIAYMLTTELSGTYHPHKYNSFEQVIMTVLTSWFLCVVSALILGFFLKISESYSRVALGVWFTVTPFCLVGWRWVSCQVRKKILHLNDEGKSVIVGATESGLALAWELESNSNLEEKLVGFYDDRPVERLDESIRSNLPAEICGNIDDALNLAKNRQVKNVYVALPMEASKRIKNILSEFSDSNVHVHFVPDFFTFDLMHSRWKNVGNLAVVSIHDTPFRGLSSILKRFEDIVFSLIILALISPVLLAVAIGVKLSSPGPVIFKQDRYGLDGKPIKVWKFRSMSTCDNGSVVKQATKNDPRVTKFGAFIRRTSLDELPQFFNVLQGRMSIVGPRPHAVAHNEEYRTQVKKYMLRHHVKPGITGLAQVNGYRGETDTLYKMEKRVEYDLKYIHHWSLWLDVKIIFLTVFKGFVGKTAY